MYSARKVLVSSPCPSLPPLLYSRTGVVEKKLGLTDRCGTSSDSPILSSVDLAVVLGFRIQKLACS